MRPPLKVHVGFWLLNSVKSCFILAMNIVYEKFSKSHAFDFDRAITIFLKIHLTGRQHKKDNSARLK